MLISLLILGVGQYIFTKYKVENTLINRLYRVKYVDKAEIKRDAGKINVYIRFKDIDDFKEAYTNVYETIHNSLGERDFDIIIDNNPDQLIKKIYNERIQFIIYEAAHTGKYDEMKKKLDEIKSDLPVKINVFIDKTNLYLHLKHDGYCFYHIIETAD